MDTVIRGIAIYLFLMLVFRLTGKRSLGQVTTFDFVLLLIISETTQQALIGDNFSVTNAFLSILTLVVLDIGMSLLKQGVPTIDNWLEGVPLVVVEEGKPLKDRMKKVQVDESDILSAARELQGLERMEQIKYAVLERNGAITIVPNIKKDGRK
jgi:uncharacterized membrane protein YcaP (DUF421 family)